MSELATHPGYWTNPDWLESSRCSSATEVSPRSRYRARYRALAVVLEKVRRDARTDVHERLRRGAFAVIRESDNEHQDENHNENDDQNDSEDLVHQQTC